MEESTNKGLTDILYKLEKKWYVRLFGKRK